MKSKKLELGVVCGYYTSNGFTTRYTEYMDFEAPDEIQSQLKEDEEFDGTVYRTIDGKLFLTDKDANAHQATLKIPELDEVLELLDKVKILCDLNKDKSPLLKTIKNVIDELNGDAGEALLDKYYDSSCY